jgi:hypothetical protein
MISIYKTVVGEPERRKPFGRNRSESEENKIDCKGIGCERAD